MRRMRIEALLLIVAVAAFAGGCLDSSSTRSRGVPPIERNEPEPGDPPVVWVSGSVEASTTDALVVRDGEGPRIHVERFAGGATAFLRPRGGRWREVPPENLSVLEAGEPVCVEAILDGGTFLAVRVFLGTECGPAP